MTAQQKIDEILKDFLSVADAAKLLGITPRAVQAAATGQRDYPPQISGIVRIGRDVFVPQSWVESRLKTNGHGRIPQNRRRNSIAGKELKNQKNSTKPSR